MRLFSFLVLSFTCYDEKVISVMQRITLCYAKQQMR